MSFDANETLENRRVLREITYNVNNSPNMSFLDQFECMKINETADDPANESLNLLEISEDKSCQNVDDINENIQQYSARRSVNLLEFSEQNLQLDETIEITNSENNLTNSNTDKALDNTFYVDSATNSSLTNVTQDKIIQPNTTVDLLYVTSTDLSKELDTPKEKDLNLNETTEIVETTSNIQNFINTTDLQLENLNNTFDGQPTDCVTNPSEVTKLEISIKLDETIKTEELESSVSDLTATSQKQLNQTVEKVDPISNESPEISVTSNSKNATIISEVKSEELDDTITFPPLRVSEDNESFLASEEYVTPTDELFQDPKDFDFLLHQTESTSEKGKRVESLYVKFDPLYDHSNMLPQSNTIVENEDQKELNKTTDASPTKLREETENCRMPDFETPKRNSLATIDKLVSVFSVEKPKAVPSEIKETKEADNVSTLDVARELEILKTNVLQLEADLDKEKRRNSEIETRNIELEARNRESQKKFDEANALNQKLNVVVDEYEQSISRIIAQGETERAAFTSEKEKLQEELRVSNQHLNNSEAAFNDVHEKYERLKGAVQILHANEKMLKEAIQENVKTIEAIENRYQVLKAHASEQLEKANVTIAANNKQHEAELAKERARLARAELQCKSLNDVVEQKTNENKELTKILDDIIARVDNTH